jgi:hypothetical protein
MGIPGLARLAHVQQQAGQRELPPNQHKKGISIMTSLLKSRLRLVIISMAVLATILSLTLTHLPTQSVKAAPPHAQALCATHPSFCTEPAEPWNSAGQYIGHDEPSVLFYSDKPGAGNSNLYQLTLPTDPKIMPSQDGTGSTWNFQLHPAFWFGMIMCDTQSAPNPGAACPADSDANIHTSLDPNSPDYFGLTPGEAFMEMQFYPPGWAPWPAGNSCDATKWCAALNIDSFSANDLTGQNQNPTCISEVGQEYVNFAFITKNGHSQAPASPVNATLATFTPDPKQDLFMNSGDRLIVNMHDTRDGFRVDIFDLTTHQFGSMTASANNGFGQVQFDPTGTSCNNIPYNFHPMFATSSENTRVLWAAHSYNVAFSDEIGHFEYCAATAGGGAPCTSAGATDPAGVDGDDRGCFGPSDSTLVPITGCLGTDVDFDGPEYGNNWPGTNPNAAQDRKFHASPILFTSPLFNGWQNYSRVAFEADLPRIEDAVSPCRFTGVGCTNPPAGATFYPFFSTVHADEGCAWAEGGPFLKNAINRFGGSSATEFGSTPFQIFYPAPGGSIFRYNDFRTILPFNPCRAL